MNKELILPELSIKDNRSYIGIAGSAIFINVPKHEYALVLTISRLTFKIIRDYDEARIATVNYYSSRESISITSLLNFSNNVESLITDLFRLSKTFEKLLNDYPKYKNILPSETSEIIKEIEVKTHELRNNAEHIYNMVIGEKSKNPKRMGLINFGLDENNILISTNKLEIAKLISWIQNLDRYSYLLSESFVEFNKSS